MITFDTETIRLINMFENLAQVTVKDCVLDKENNTVIFIVGENEAGYAIGRGGNKIRIIEKLINKKIKVFEYSPNLKKFVKNLIPYATNISIEEKDGGKIVKIWVDKLNKFHVIGRNKRNLKLYKLILERNHRVKDLIVK